jgi:hypothetical protein
MPVRSASTSISSSPSSVDCGTPKPRKAPATLLWVSTARVWARTLAMRYGPLAWIGTRLATVGPHDEYAPVLKSPAKSKATRRPSASQAALARIVAGWRLVLDCIDSGRS